MNEHRDQNVNEWTGRMKIAFAALAVIAGFFLVAEHRAHLLPYLSYLPFLLLAACPLMHIFMHGKHGSHGAGDSDEGTRNRQAPPSSRNRDTPAIPTPHRHGDMQ